MSMNTTLWSVKTDSFKKSIKLIKAAPWDNINFRF